VKRLRNYRRQASIFLIHFPAKHPPLVETIPPKLSASPRLPSSALVCKAHRFFDRPPHVVLGSDQRQDCESFSASAEDGTSEAMSHEAVRLVTEASDSLRIHLKEFSLIQNSIYCWSGLFL